jgi:DNA-binding MarR family transcriptional regulator
MKGKSNRPAALLWRELEALVVLHNKIDRAITRGEQLTPEQTYIIRTAAREGGLENRELLALTGWRKDHASTTTGHLVRAGLLDSRGDKQDRRRQIFRATFKGCEAVSRLDEAAEIAIRSAEPKIAAKARELLAALRRATTIIGHAHSPKQVEGNSETETRQQMSIVESSTEMLDFVNREQ